jgi:hypothetical protein
VGCQQSPELVEGLLHVLGFRIPHQGEEFADAHVLVEQDGDDGRSATAVCPWTALTVTGGYGGWSGVSGHAGGGRAAARAASVTTRHTGLPGAATGRPHRFRVAGGGTRLEAALPVTRAVLLLDGRWIP